MSKFLKALSLPQASFLLLSFLFTCNPVAGAAPAPAPDTLSLQITDSTRAAIPGTRITILNASGQTISTAVTDGAGAASIEKLPTGAYTLLIEREGFASERRPINLSGSPVSILVALVPASVGDTVTVVDKGYALATSSSATNLEVPLRDVPRDVAVVSRELLDDQGVIALKDAVSNASGVHASYARGDNANTFNIRGFQQFEMFRDGLRDNQGYSVQETADLESVEILKGPASILYGQVAPGGIVNLTSKRPVAARFTTVEMQTGSFGLARPSFDTGGSLTPTGSLLYRLNAVYQNSGSFRDFSNTDRNFVAPSLSYTFRERTRLDINFEYLKNHAAFDYGVPGYGNRPYSLPINFSSGGPNTRVDEKQFRGGVRIVHQFKPNLSLHESFSAASATNTEGAFQSAGVEADGRTLDRYAFRFPYTFNTYNLQNDLHASFRTGKISHTFLAGGLWSYRLAPTYYFAYGSTNYTLDLLHPVYVPLPNLPVTTADLYFPFTQNQGGGYAQDLLSLTSRLKLLAGLSYTDYVGRDEGATRNDTIYTKAHAFTPQLGAIYRFADPVSLYGSWAKSFTPVSGRSAQGKTFQPQLGQQFELGAKTELLHNRLTGTLSLYHITLSNVLAPDPANPNFSISAGKQRSQGVELDLAGKITPGWNVNFNYAFLQAGVIGTTEGDTIPVGTPLANDPRHGSNLFTTYELRRGVLRNLSFGGGISGQTYRFASLGGPVVLPGYAKADLHASYGVMVHDRLRYKVQLNVFNLTDRHYFEFGNSGGSIPGSPRAANATVKMFF